MHPHGRLECVKTLIEAYKEGASVKDNEGWLPIHYAVQQGTLECVIIVSQAYKEGTTMKDRYGRSPIFIALNHRKANIVSYFLKETDHSILLGSL